MAALPQIDLQEAAILGVIASIQMPEGIRFRRLEFRDNNLGDPSVFVIYSVLEGLVADAEMAERIGKVKWATLNPLWQLPLAVTAYTWFEAA